MTNQTFNLQRIAPLLPASAVLLLAVIAPWFFGGAPWGVQSSLLCTGLVISVLFAASLFRSGKTWVVNKYLSRYWFITLLLSTIALLQCLPIPTFLSRTPIGQGIDAKDKFLVNSVATDVKSPQDTAETDSKSNASFEGYRNWTNSIDPIHSLAAVGSFGLVLLALLTSYRTTTLFPQWVYPVLLLLMLSGVSIAVVGIIEKLTPNEWRVLDTRISSSFAGFVSRSSAAAFLNIGLAAAIGCFGFQSRIDHKYRIDPNYRADDRGLFSQLRIQLEELVSEISTQKVLILSSAIIIVVGILMSLSRGGAISGLAAMLSLIAVNLFRRNLIASVSMVILVLFTSLTALRMLDRLEIVQNRLETISKSDLIIDSGRWQAWGYAIDTAKELWLTGGGLGNFHYAYLPYQSRPTDSWFYHAESLYLQALSDLGLIGFCALLFAVVTLTTPIRHLISQPKFSVGKAVGSCLLYLTISLGIHSISDFSLILPALYLPVAIIIGISFATLDLKSSSKARSKRRKPSSTSSQQGFKLKIQTPTSWSVWLGLTPSLLILIGMFFIRPKAAAELTERQMDRWSVETDSNGDHLKEIIAQGETQLARFPNEGELNMAMAKAYTQLYRILIRDQAKLAWEQTLPVFTRDTFYKRSRIENLSVDKLLENPEATAALKKAELCWLRAHYALPLDWRPHWGLVELDFVGQNGNQSPEHLEHLRVLARNRPELLLTAGIAAIDYPGRDSAIPILKQVATDYVRKAPIVLKVAYQAFGDQAFSDEFIPEDSNVMLNLAENIQVVNATPKSLTKFWQTILKHAEKLSDDDRNKSTLLAYCYHETGDIENEYQTLNKAIERSPMNTYIRYLLAKNLIRRKEFEKAETHIEFCLRQEPAKKEFLQLKDQLNRERVPVPAIVP